MSKSTADGMAVPEGFKALHYSGDTFNALVGPVYIKRTDADAILGCRVEHRHCNPAGIVHGGMLMTLSDMTAGFCTGYKTGIKKFMPTINMTFDFFAPGKVGHWIEGYAEVMKTTRSLAFAAVELRVGSERLLRASCIMKIPAGDGLPFERARMVGRVTDGLRPVE